jgi:hypothetical protein
MSAEFEFNLRGLVREVLRSSTIADPGAVAVEVLKRIPSRMHKAALGQALRLYVRQVISEERISHRSEPAAAHQPPARSAKVAGIRDGWQKRLRDRVHCNGTWKFLAACTYDDLLAAAAERRQLADRNQAWARQYDAWARLLTEHDAETFGDLPTEAQMSALGSAA